MNGPWLQARAMAKLAEHNERLAYLEHREMMIAHDELIAMSYSYPKDGKAFKCGPWRWRVFSVPGTVLRRTVKRDGI